MAWYGSLDGLEIDMGIKLASIAKAITGFLVAGYAVYQTATLASSPGGESVTSSEWTGVLVAGAVAGLAIWLVPNDTTPTPPRP